MEYQLKLSEVIAGCESGAWLEGAKFESNRGSLVEFRERGFIWFCRCSSIDENWRFVEYEY